MTQEPAVPAPGVRHRRILAAAQSLRLVLFRSETIEYGFAIAGATTTIALGVLAGGILPLVVAILSLLGGAALIPSGNARLSAYGVGLMVGSIAAGWDGLDGLGRLGVGPKPGPWVPGLFFVLVGVCMGWMMHASNQRMALGTGREMAKKVAEMLAYPLSILAALLSFTLGVPVARTVVGNLSVGAVSAALALGLGLCVGDQVAELHETTRLSSDSAQS